MTNEPPFTQQLFNLNNYMQLSPKQPENRFCAHLPLRQYSRGMGALGLPGDGSSMSRFVRAAFVKLHAMGGHTEGERVGQFFHLLDTVAQVRGCCETAPGQLEYTLYASCCNATRGIYYYTTYESRQITAVNLRREPLGGSSLRSYPLLQTQQITVQN